MIKINSSSARIVRETTAPFEYIEDGEIKNVDIRVRYFGARVADIKKLRREIEERAKTDPNAIIWLSEEVHLRIESLPDLIGDDGLPVAVSVDFLESLDIKNLQAIKNAIQAADNPK